MSTTAQPRRSTVTPTHHSSTTTRPKVYHTSRIRPAIKHTIANTSPYQTDLFGNIHRSNLESDSLYPSVLMDQLPAQTKVLLHGNGLIECLDQGNFPHPASCKKFISCSKMENGKMIGWEYTCPRNLSFDPIGGICNWSTDVLCDVN
ncbi:uncharacterized protein LOC130903899 [Diorhabda carinulata]|uniref:uncharacterized protein LOC130903899 n=1 Tax=Diorhabda carinulata TaxID=1163345 RepID=UPI0025A001FC|nr:uncharacterized protein LOC130903899 [Diorhabda carinulata]XP_057672254.1 uncharacterized protein LOC130903899 [Diorhabda carinulata]XP_057672255.1 uncharacterized protein LOC130903899 [Diorhabda carinulata]